MTPPTQSVAALPVVGFTPRKEFAGIYHVSQTSNVQPLGNAPFVDAFRHHHEVDAFFVSYQLWSATGPAPEWPRCNKPSVPSLSDAGYEVVSTMIGLDYDTAGKVPWTAASWQAFLERLDKIAQTFPLVASYTAFYATKHGARWVYVLTQPVLAETIEPFIQGMVELFRQAGILLDEACVDWTRLFRLPLVTRTNDDGTTEETWKTTISAVEPIFESLDNRLDLAQIPPVKPKKGRFNCEYGDIEYDRSEQPLPEEAKKWLEVVNPATGRMMPSQFSKIAKKRLTGTAAYGPLYEGREIAKPGKINDTKFSLVGTTINALFGFRDACKEAIFGLWYDAWIACTPEKVEWCLGQLWDMVERLWAREAAKKKTAAAQEDATAGDASTVLQTMLAGVREWCEEPAVRGGDDSAAFDWITRHLIVVCDKTCFPMRRDGWYDSLGVSRENLTARIRELGMNHIIRTDVPDKNGDRIVSAGELIHHHGTLVGQLRGLPQLKGAKLEQPDTDEATLALRTYARREDIEPTFDEDVDHWLRLFFGEKHFAKGCKWIGHALAFDEGPICALSIDGPPSIGKGLFMQALAECLTTGKFADGSDLTADFAYGLMKSCFLSVNEGLPARVPGALDAADAFRRLVSGEIPPVNRKFMAPVHVNNPMRIVVTANNYDVVQILAAGKKDLSPGDQNAIALRLFHVKADDAAARWLTQKGGLAFTGKAGRRWIAGKGNAPSNYVVAKHFLWLYQNRGAALGTNGRFLVEGDADEEFMLEMRTQSTTAGVVVEILAELITESATGRARPREGFAIQDGKIYVLTSEILKFSRESTSFKNAASLNSTSAGKSLHGLCRGQPQKKVLESRRKIGQQRWWEINAAGLLAACRRAGWPCPKLEALVEGPQLELVVPRQVQSALTVPMIEGEAKA